MKNRVWKGCLLIFLVGLVAVGGCAVVATSPRYRRTPLGHLTRYVEGESGGEQTANDLAGVLQSRIGAEKLQQWAVGALARDRSRTLKLEGSMAYWPAGTLRLRTAEVPPILEHKWPEPPKVFVHRSPSGQSDYIVVSWDLYGILVGTPSYLGDNPWYLRRVRPGVYVYYCYR